MQKRAHTGKTRRLPDGGLLRGMLLGLLLWSIVLALHYAGGSIPQTDAAVGQRAASTVVATVGFTHPNTARTELLRQRAADDVLPVFRIDTSALHTASRTLGRLFERVAQVRQESVAEGTGAAAVEDLLADALYLLTLPITTEQALALAPPEGEQQALQAIRGALQTVWNQGIISAAERDARLARLPAQRAVTIHGETAPIRSPVPLDELLLPEQAVRRAVALVSETHPDPPLPQDALEALLAAVAVPNLRYDAALTDAQREESRRRVPPVQATVESGNTIVEAGELITPQILSALVAHAQRRAEMESPRDRFLNRIGTAGLLFLSLVIALGLLRVLDPDTAADARAVALFGLLSLAVLVPAKLLLFASGPSGWLPSALVQPLLPIGLAPLLGAILLRGSAAAIVGIWTSLCVAIFFGHSFFLLVVGLVVTVVSAGCAGEIHRRSKLLRAGLFIGLASVATVLCFGAIHQQSAAVLGMQVLYALLSGLVTALLAVLLIPIFEWLFGLTTDITLLELSDMSHPVLHRLAIEAPGTYHHSLMVANLAQAAAARIGAHSLLVRVCAYYHDIGKLTKPEFFVENTQFSQNPHDDLSPSMSALVIISHVKEGLALAQRHKLPRPILDGIAQHHGTGLILYFYHRAVKQQEAQGQSGGSRPIRDEDFRYSGPKPRSPEMGILLLADAVEAASRSMEKPTAGRIESLVAEIVDDRLRDGQLDHCRLTFADLARIRKSFVFTLTNMLHGRVAYPKHEDRDQQSAKPASHPAQEPAALHPVGHGTG
jgi:hypothetical protein